MEFPLSFTEPPPHSGYRASFADYSQPRPSQSSPPHLTSPLLPPTHDTPTASSVLAILQPLRAPPTILGNTQSMDVLPSSSHLSSIPLPPLPPPQPMVMPVSVSVPPVPSLISISNPYPPKVDHTSSSSSSSSPSSSTSDEPQAKKRKDSVLPSIVEDEKEKLMNLKKEEIVELLLKERIQNRRSTAQMNETKKDLHTVISSSADRMEQTEGTEREEMDERCQPREVGAAPENWKKIRMMKMDKSVIVDLLLIREREIGEVMHKMGELERELKGLKEKKTMVVHHEEVIDEERDEEEDEEEEEVKTEVTTPTNGKKEWVYKDIAYLGDVEVYYDDYGGRFFTEMGATVNWTNGTCSSTSLKDMDFHLPEKHEMLKEYIDDCIECGIPIQKKVQNALIKLKVPVKKWIKDATALRKKMKEEELKKEREEEEMKRKEEEKKNKRGGGSHV